MHDDERDDGHSNMGGVGVLDLREHPDVSARRVLKQGMLRVNGVASAETCALLRERLDSTLAEAQSVQGTAPSDMRWDLFLPLDACVLGMLSEAIGQLRPLLDRLFTPDATLCELAGLVTDGGSPRQGLHFDTGVEDGASLLLTCFIALQDINEDMGGTIMLPCTANAAAHQQMSHVCEALLGNMLGTHAVVGTLAQLPIVRCAIRAGDVVCMDSRLLHCGGANTTRTRRRLFYFTIKDGGGMPLPRGASFSMFPAYRDKLCLSEVDDWAEYMDGNVHAADGLATTPPR
jgi:hypothetical protein